MEPRLGNTRPVCGYPAGEQPIDLHPDDEKHHVTAILRACNDMQGS